MPPKAGTAYVQIEGDFSALNKQVGAQLGKLAKRGAGLGKSLGHGIGLGVGTGAKVGAVGVAALSAEVVRATKGWADHQAVVRRSQAVIKSTGGVANVTAKQVGTLSDAIERKTGVDGDAIQSGANLLLTFTNVRNGVGKNNKIFDQATSTLVNMSKALGQDTKSSAIQLGKALNDPVKGVTALQRVGVSFDATQKKQIENFVKTGQTMKAQQLILRELGKEFPKVDATPFERLVVVGHQVEDTIGKAVLPVFNDFIKTVTPGLEHVANVADEAFSDKHLNFEEKFKKIGGSARHWFGPIADDMVQGLKDAHLDDKLEDTIEWATPKILAGFGAAGPRAAKAFITGFEEAPTWGKVAGGAFLAQKFGLTVPAFKLLANFVTGKGPALNKAAPMPVFVVNQVGGPGVPGGPKPVPTGAPSTFAQGARTAIAKGAGAVGGARLLPALGAAAPIIGAASLPFILSKDKSDLGLLDQYAAKMQTAIKAGDPVKLQALAKNLRDTARANEDLTKAPHLKAFADLLDQTAQRGGKDTSALVQAFQALPRSTGGALNQVTASLKRWHAEANSQAVQNWTRTVVSSDPVLRTHASRLEAARAKLAGLRKGSDEYVGAAARVRSEQKALNDRLLSTLNVTPDVKDALKSLGVNFTELGGDVQTAASYIAAAVNQVLSGLGAETIKFSLKQSKKIDKSFGGRAPAGGKQRGGHIPGARTGDRIPAMLEEGEYVVNRRAVQKVGRDALDRINYGLAPRFQTGGLASIQGAANSIDKRHYPYLWGGGHNSAFTGPYDCSGAVSAILHAAGLLDMPMVASQFMNYGLPGPGPVTIIANPGHVYSRLGGRFWGTSTSNPGGGAGWFDGSVRSGFTVRHIPVTPAQIGALGIEGPEGPLRDILGGSERTMRGAANDRIQSALASVGQLGGGDPGDVDAKAGKSGALGKSQLKSLWVRAGGDPKIANIMAAIALAESGGIPTRNNADRPGDGGHHIAAGLWQILGLPFEGDAYDPLTNAKMAVAKYKSQGFRAWEVYTKGTYRQYLQQGGLVAKLADGFQNGGAVLARAASKVGKPKPGHKPANTKVKDRIAKHLANIGFGAIQGKLDGLAQAVAVDDDYAQRLSGLANTDAIQDALNAELTKRGGTSGMTDGQINAIFPPAQQDALIQSMLPRIQGMTQVDWLNKELGDLLGERNVLLDEPDILDRIKKQVEAQIKSLNEVIKRHEKIIAEYVKERDRVKAQQDRVHEALTDTRKELKSELGKKKPNAGRVKRLREHEDKYRSQEIALREGSHDDLVRLGLIDGRDSDPFKHSHAWYVDNLRQERTDNKARTDTVDQLTNSSDDGVVSLPNIAGALSSVTDSLGTIQGLGSPMTKYTSSAEFPIGTLGGTVLGVQQSIGELVNKPQRAEATADGAAQADEDPTKDMLAELLRQANLRTSVSEAQFEVLRNIPFGGSFKDGGVVPGPFGAPRLILAHGGEVVTPTDALAPGDAGGAQVQINVAPGMEWLRQFIDVRVEQQTRRQGRAGERNLPGRAGSLR